MSEEQILICDRCKKHIDIFNPPEGALDSFYVTTNKAVWGKYTTPDERLLCVECVWDDPNHLADFPHARPPSDPPYVVGQRLTKLADSSIVICVGVDANARTAKVSHIDSDLIETLGWHELAVIGNLSATVLGRSTTGG